METTSTRHNVSEKQASIDGLLVDGWFDLHALLGRFALQVGAVARSTGKFIEVTISKQTPRYFSGDNLRLIDVLNNVAAYALSHLDEGCILFNIDAYPIKQCKYRIDIVVVTTGVGIPYHRVNAVYLPDYNRSGQSGNSLFVAKTIASLMGGDLTIENTFGWGTRYLVHLIMESEVPEHPIHSKHSITTGCVA